MNTMRICKSIMAAVAAVSLVGCASSGGPKISDTHFAADEIGPSVESGELPGAIVVLHHDGVEERTCLGWANVEKKRPMTMDCIFQQCSQTKGFCGVTVAKLVEEGKLSLDDPLEKFFPVMKDMWVVESETNGVRKLRRAKTPITVRMVMNHTSGLPFEVPGHCPSGGWSRTMPLSSKPAMATSIPLKFEPGTSTAYSNLGIDLGAAVVEKVTGMRWEEYLQKAVFDPLGMDNSTFWPTEEQLANRIDLYRTKKGEKAKFADYSEAMQPPYSDDRVFASAGAGLWTTVNDQLKFYKMLMNLGMGENGVRILKEDTVRNLLAKSTRPAKLGGYSLGLNAPVTDTEDSWFGHGGAWASNCNINYHRKELQLVAVQLLGSYGCREMTRRAAEKFFKSAVDNSGVEAYTGRLK